MNAVLDPSEPQSCERCHTPFAADDNVRLDDGLFVHADRPCGLTADEFNDRYPVGTPVCFWPGRRRGEGMEGRTRTPAWTLGDGEPVVACDGWPGGIALTHVEVTGTEAVTP